MEQNLDFSKYPEIEEVIRITKELEIRNWEKYDGSQDLEDYLDNMHQILTKDLWVFPQILLRFDGSMDLPLKFYRAREVSSIKNREIRSEYSYPPVASVKTQRANLKNYPVFYAADDPLTAILEVLNKEHYDDAIGKKFIISRWEIINAKDIILAPFLFEGLNSDNPFIGLSEIWNQQIRTLNKDNLSNSQIEGFLEILRFYSRVFLNDKDHAISSYIAHHYIHKDFSIKSDVFIYPSIRSDRRTVNFAIHPNFSDENMYIKSLYLVEIKEIEEIKNTIERVRFKILEYGISRGFRILWKRLSENDKIFPQMFKEDWADAIQLENDVVNNGGK